MHSSVIAQDGCVNIQRLKLRCSLVSLNNSNDDAEINLHLAAKLIVFKGYASRRIWLCHEI